MQTAQQRKMMAVLRQKGATSLVGKYKVHAKDLKFKTITVKPSIHGNTYLPVQFGTDDNGVSHRMSISGMKDTLAKFKARKISN